MSAPCPGFDEAERTQGLHPRHDFPQQLVGHEGIEAWRGEAPEGDELQAEV